VKGPFLASSIFEAIEATRLPASTPGPSTRAPAGRRPLVAVVRLVELGEVGVLSSEKLVCCLRPRLCRCLYSPAGAVRPPRAAAYFA